MLDPEPPTALTAGTKTTTSIAVTWTASPSLTVTSYGLYRDSASTGTTSGTSYTFTGLACGTTYNLSVDAADVLGNRSSKASIDTATTACPDTQAPTAPGALAATAATRTSIAVSWSASTDNTGVTGYTVYKNGSSVTTTTGTSNTFAGLSCGTSYTLAVDAYDAKGNHSAKTSATLSTSPCPDTVAPTAPPNLTVVGTSGTSISIAWTTSLDDTGVAAYGLYRNGSSVGSTPGTSYTFTGLACGTSYSLAVDAVDDAGNRSAKSLAGASTSACPGDTSAPTVPTGLRVGTTGATTIAVSWTASTDNTGVAGYGAYNGTSLAGTTASTSYTFTGLACGNNYTLAVDAYDAAGNRSGKATVTGSTTACSDTTAPSTPTGLTVGATSSSTIAISWTASTDNRGVTGYGAYNGANLAGSPTSTSYTFNGLACGTSYTLAVDAFDAAGNRSGKATANGSTTACPPPPPPGNGNGNLWVDTNGGSCTRQATAGSYVDSQACGSFNSAYAAASPGDTIYIKGGTYTAFQDIAFRSIGTTPVRLQAAPNENVILDNGMTIRTHDLIFEGGGTVGANEPDRISVYGSSSEESAIDFGRGNNSPNVKGNVIEDVHTRDVYFDDNTTDNAVRYSEVGPSDFGGNGNLCADLIVTGHTFNPVIEYNQIHDNKNDGCNGAHIDALDLNVTNGIIRGNRIWWCGTQCIFSGDPGSMLIENNMIEETNACGSGCDGPQELAVMGTVTFRYNTIEGDDGYGRDPDRPGNADVYGNVFLSNHGASCGGSGAVKTSFHDNVFAPGSGTCGSNAKFCTPRLASTGQPWTNVDQKADFHLASNDTCAMGAGASANVAPRDIDEQSRPQGGSVDAGADDR